MPHGYTKAEPAWPIWSTQVGLVNAPAACPWIRVTPAVADTIAQAATAPTTMLRPRLK